jgi:hypothetical protein
MTAPRARAVRRPCLACCTVFEMPPAEVAWFAERGWSLPTHCADCRRRRRLERREVGSVESPSLGGDDDDGAR